MSVIVELLQRMLIHFDAGVWVQIELSSPISMHQDSLSLSKQELSYKDALPATEHGQRAEINHLQQDDRNQYRPVCLDAYLLYWSLAMRWRWTQRPSQSGAMQFKLGHVRVLRVELHNM